jgi:hypothetical protein
VIPSLRTPAAQEIVVVGCEVSGPLEHRYSAPTSHATSVINYHDWSPFSLRTRARLVRARER